MRPLPGTRLLSLAISLWTPQGTFNSPLITELPIPPEVWGGEVSWPQTSRQWHPHGHPKAHVLSWCRQQGPPVNIACQHPPCPFQLYLCLFNILDYQETITSTRSRKSKSWFGPDVVSRPDAHTDLDKEVSCSLGPFPLLTPTSSTHLGKESWEGQEGDREAWRGQGGPGTHQMSPRQPSLAPNTT